MPGTHSWPSTVIPLPPTGALALYTDGLTEGHNGATGERLGVEGLLALMGKLPLADPAAYVDFLIVETHELNAGRHSDDLAVLRLDWSSSGPQNRGFAVRAEPDRHGSSVGPPIE